MILELLTGVKSVPRILVFYFKFNEKPLKSFRQGNDIQSEVLRKIALAALSRQHWR